MVRYSDGNVFAIPTTRSRIGIQQVSKIYEDQNFHLVLLNRGANLITVFVKSIAGDEERIEVPPSSPGIVLDGISYDKLVNGIDAIASVGTTNLMVNLYSNDITFQPRTFSNAEVSAITGFPRDTFQYPEARNP
jgi:hypothetical protein